jgi:hypothetical protein
MLVIETKVSAVESTRFSGMDNETHFQGSHMAETLRTLRFDMLMIRTKVAEIIRGIHYAKRCSQFCNQTLSPVLSRIKTPCILRLDMLHIKT